MEKWMGDHDTWLGAVKEMDINYWSILSSAAEAIWKNKYAAVAASAFSDAMNYTMTTSNFTMCLFSAS